MIFIINICVIQIIIDAIVEIRIIVLFVLPVQIPALGAKSYHFPRHNITFDIFWPRELLWPVFVKLRKCAIEWC